MIVRVNETKHETRTEMRGGTGNIEIDHLLSDKPAHCRMFSTLTLVPGASIGEHLHEKETEIFYVLEGTAQYLDNGIETVLNKGDIASTGSGQSHGVRNDGDSALVLLAVIITE